MDVKFGEIREFVSKIDRVSVCMVETLQYENYRYVEEVPDTYDDKYLYGFGMIESEITDSSPITMRAHLEIMLADSPKQIVINRRNFRKLIDTLRKSPIVDGIARHKDTILKFFPVLEDTIDFDQKNDAHQYDLWYHSLHTVVNLPRNQKDDMLYLAALLHDIGKLCDESYNDPEDDADMHYFKHSFISALIVKEQIIPYLLSLGISFTEEEIERLLHYIKYHDYKMDADVRAVCKHSSEIEIEVYRDQAFLEIADAKAQVQTPQALERIEVCTKIVEALADELSKRVQSSNVR